MPSRPMRPCRHPACAGLTTDTSGYCDEHQQYGKIVKKQSRTFKGTIPFYGTVAWQRFRDWYKSKHPLCEDCLEHDKLVPVYCVDHIKEIKDGGARLDEQNARSLCRSCHGIKTAEAKRKRGRAG